MWCRLLLVLCLFWFPRPAWADYYDGLRAFDAGDFATAYKEWRASAIADNPKAQLKLGELFEKGIGVPQNFERALAWYSIAGSRGLAEARRAREALAGRMTATQLAKARELAVDLSSSVTTQQTEIETQGTISKPTEKPEPDVSRSARVTFDLYDGEWSGIGKNSPSSRRIRCGHGPKIEIRIVGNAVRGSLSLTITHFNINSQLERFEGTIDKTGKIDLRTTEVIVVGSLSANDQSGHGIWKLVGVGCKGIFKLDRKF